MNRKRNKVDMEKIFAVVISLSIMVALVVGVMSILKSNKSGNEDKKNYIDLNEINEVLNDENPDNGETQQMANQGGKTQNENEQTTAEPQKTANGKNGERELGEDNTEDGQAANLPTEAPDSGHAANDSKKPSEGGDKDVASASGDEGSKNTENETDAKQVDAPLQGVTGDSSQLAQGQEPTSAASEGNQTASGETPSGPDNPQPVQEGDSQEAPSDVASGNENPEDEIPAGENIPDTATPVNASTASLLGYNFGEESTLMWPTQGNVILNYNMTNTIYFPTLDVYRCNPAVIISAEEGSVVSAAADGIVMSVYETKETGLTMEIAVGNDYVLTYGQLKDLVVGVGSQVKRGDVLGSVAAPSQYYTVEGSNLYFRVNNAQGPVNPMDFIE